MLAAIGFPPLRSSPLLVNGIYVLKEFGYDTVIVPDEDDDYCTATIRIKVTRDFFNWLFTNQPSIMIEGPTIVENMYRRYVESVSKQYAYKHMEPGEVICKFMELMYEKVKDKNLLMALQEQYIIIDNHDTYKKLSKDPTFTVLKNVFKRKKAKKT